MKTVGRYPERDEATGRFKGALSSAFELTGRQMSEVRKLMAEGPVFPSQAAARITDGNPASQMQCEAISRFQQYLVSNGEAVVTTREGRGGRAVYAGIKLSDRGKELLDKGL